MDEDRDYSEKLESTLNMLEELEQYPLLFSRLAKIGSLSAFRAALKRLNHTLDNIDEN